MKLIDEELRLEKMVEELNEIDQLKKQMQFKATPIKKYRFVTKPVEPKQLTCPTMPNLTTEKRAMFKEMRNELN